MTEEPQAESRKDDLVLDFGRIFAILRRAWWLIGGLGLSGGLVAAIIVLQMTPVYQSGGELLLGQKSRVDDAVGTLFQDLRLDDAAMSGEVAIITSGRLLAQVTEQLDLNGHPEFNPDLRPPEPEPGLITQAADGAVNLLRAALGLEVEEEVVIEASEPGVAPVRDAAMTGKSALGDQADYVDLLRSGIRVQRVGNSNLVEVRYTTPDRFLAAAVPNALIDVYLADQVNRRFNVLSRAATGLEGRLDDMRQRLE
ncbi:MAG: Wzz/FepE/Etk N-terminal domain-containing protein, partial [Pseudomonadota bacterium]